jgi:hypothetical protein
LTRRRCAEEFFPKSVDTLEFSRKLRAPMKHQSTNFCTRQRWALKACAGNPMNSCDAPPRALEIVMR